MELFELTKKTFIVTSVNINKHSVVYFSHTSHPHMSVVKSIRMSISIPFLFTPVEHEGCLYVDGGCIDNFPLRLFSKNKDELIGIYLLNSTNASRIKSFNDYAVGVINSIIDGINELTVKKFNGCIIGIDMSPFNSIDFTVSLNNKKVMFDVGYKTTCNFIDHLV